MPAVERLCARNLDKLNPEVRRPAFDRRTSGLGIVHLGVGAFMRSHIAEYTDDALEAGRGDWTIAGVSLRKPDVRDRLAPQDCLYILGSRDDTGERRRLIGSLESMHVAPENPKHLIGLLADERVRVVTLTVTEKGYCLDPGSGQLSLAHPDIRHDLENPDRPRSTIGYLAAALQLRMQSAVRPPTIVSCDNLPSNGACLRSAVLAFARERGPAFASWVAGTVSFPETMVDRIVPATTEADISLNAGACGLRDEAYVKTEPFREWVIEDAFSNGRPPWDAGGALFVANVAPFEAAKLKLLNGPHSAIAYLGYLAGFNFVHEAMGDPDFSTFISRMMTHDISPVAPEPDEMDHKTYIKELLRRFGNSALEHRTWQIAMDGSQKLPQRILSTVRAQLAQGGPVASLGVVVAAWMRYALGRDEQGGQIDVSDPLAGRFAAIAADKHASPADIADRFLEITEIFGDDLPQDRRFRSTVAESLRQLFEYGALETVRRFVRLG